MTGTVQKKKGASGKEYLYIILSYKDPMTFKRKQKSISTGLKAKGNKRKAETLIPELIKKFEYLERPVADYLHMMEDISTIRKKEAEREELLARLEKMQGGNVGQLEEEKERLKEQQVLNEKNLEQIRKEIWGRESRIRQADVQYLDISSQLKE